MSTETLIIRQYFISQMTYVSFADLPIEISCVVYENIPNRPEQMFVIYSSVISRSLTTSTVVRHSSIQRIRV